MSSVAIIAGASQGIGRSTAIRLARDFPAIVLAARNADALRETGGECKGRRNGAIPLCSRSEQSRVCQGTCQENTRSIRQD
jgi:NAD(P)-dependent dehydrogenase (short-subunit alcohol dehydrogenase family)